VRARFVGVLTAAAFVATGLTVAPDAFAAETIVVRITPPSPQVDDTLTLIATVSEAMPASLSVTRTDRNNNQTMFMALPTGNAGEYSMPDPGPPVWGHLSYVVKDVPRDVQGSTSVFVSRLPTALSIKASRRIVTFRHGVRVTAHLGTTQTNRRVTIYARPYNGDRRTIGSGTVDPTSGNRSATFTVLRRTLFRAHFSGDGTYAPANAYVVVRARAVLRERLRHYYATSGGYRIYHPGASPELDARLWPRQQGVCLYFRAQYHSGGSWRNASLSPCVRTDTDALAAALLHNALALPYRLRAEWRGNHIAAASHGPWLRLRFR
jgi:hypothetical protein